MLMLSLGLRSTLSPLSKKTSNLSLSRVLLISAACCSLSKNASTDPAVLDTPPESALWMRSTMVCSSGSSRSPCCSLSCSSSSPCFSAWAVSLSPPRSTFSSASGILSCPPEFPDCAQATGKMFCMVAGDSTKIGIIKKNNVTTATAATYLPPAAYHGLDVLCRKATFFNIEIDWRV